MRSDRTTAWQVWFGIFQKSAEENMSTFYFKHPTFSINFDSLWTSTLVFLIGKQRGSLLRLWYFFRFICMCKYFFNLTDITGNSCLLYSLSVIKKHPPASIMNIHNCGSMSFQTKIREPGKTFVWLYFLHQSPIDHCLHCSYQQFYNTRRSSLHTYDLLPNNCVHLI